MEGIKKHAAVETKKKLKKTIFFYHLLTLELIHWLNLNF